MRILSFLLKVILLVFFFIGAVTFWKGIQEGNWLTGWVKATMGNSHSSNSVVLQEVTAMGKLELVKYNFKDVVEEQLVREWLPNSKAILIVHGEAIGCIDLQKLQDRDLVRKGDTLIVHLPEPEVCIFRIDHERSKVHSTEYAFFDEGKLVADAYKQAEKVIRTSALEMGIIEQTKINAKVILGPILEKVNGGPVVLKFKLDSEIQKLR